MPLPQLEGSLGSNVLPEWYYLANAEVGVAKHPALSRYVEVVHDVVMILHVVRWAGGTPSRRSELG